MVTERVQFRVVAAVYALFGAAFLLWIVTVRTMASFGPAASLTRHVAERSASTIPRVTALAIACIVLSGLSLRFVASNRWWQIATTAGSVLFSLLLLLAGARTSFTNVPAYLGAGGGYSALAILLGVWWSPPLISSFCSYLLWRQLRASNNRFERSRATTSVSQGGSR
jgi:hypothetical protein